MIREVKRMNDLNLEGEGQVKDGIDEWEEDDAVN